MNKKNYSKSIQNSKFALKFVNRFMTEVVPEFPEFQSILVNYDYSAVFVTYMIDINAQISFYQKNNPLLFINHWLLLLYSTSINVDYNFNFGVFEEFLAFSFQTNPVTLRKETFAPPPMLYSDFCRFLTETLSRQS